MPHPFDAQSRLDRLVEWLSPAQATRRYAARTQLDMARQLPEASFRGAVHTRSAQPWSDTTSYWGGTSADRASQRSMGARGRKVYENNVIGAGLLDAETDNVVADGYSLQMLTTDEAFNREAEERFYKWLDRADIMGLATGSELFRMSWREPRKDGDGGIVLIKRGGAPKLQYIPGDLIQNPQTYRYDSQEWFDGIRTNRQGRPVGFNVRDVDEKGKNTDTYLSADDFIYLAPRRQPTGLRGTTVYSRVFTQLDQVDAYVDAVTKASIMAAIFGLIEKRVNPSAALSGLGSMTNTAGDSQKVISYENGMLKVLGTEEGVYQVQAQQPMQQTPEFIRALLRLTCLAFDMPLEIGLRDLSQVNFSGGRIGLIGYYRSCRTKQDWHLSRCWNRLAFWWLSVERQRRELGFEDAFVSAFPADYGKYELHGREWDYTDPVSEAQADLLEISMGIKSEQQASELRGRDWRKTQEQIAESRRIKGELGIPNVLSSLTRDELAKVTAVDANGNPLSGAAEPLSGAQITAAIDVLAKSREGSLSDEAAAELLVQIGMPIDRANAIVKSLSKLTTGTGDVAFKREILKQLLAVPAAREAIYEGTDMEDLIMQTGLSPEKDYEFPHIPIVASSGPLVSGATIQDPEGDIVGGDVENLIPVDLPGDSNETGSITGPINPQFPDTWTLNEKRAADGKPALPDGDAVFMPSGQIPAVEAPKAAPDNEALPSQPAEQPAPEQSDSAADMDMGPDPEAAKALADIVSIAARAGALNPQVEDEELIRQRAGLPPLSESARAAWRNKPVDAATPAETTTGTPMPDDQMPIEGMPDEMDEEE